MFASSVQHWLISPRTKLKESNRSKFHAGRLGSHVQEMGCVTLFLTFVCSARDDIAQRSSSLGSNAC